MHWRKRGNHVVAPLAPLPASRWPNFFQSGTGPFKYFSSVCFSFYNNSSKNCWLIKISGLFFIETCDKAPVPSIQIIPAPMPPIGNATLIQEFICVFTIILSFSCYGFICILRLCRILFRLRIYDTAAEIMQQQFRLHQFCFKNDLRPDLFFMLQICIRNIKKK